ncbi:MAG: serine/threonine-protein kinase [Chloroflexi bacterium]|nr:serine/threonine-protein kinase [Chloroflexota bacterium]
MNPPTEPLNKIGRYEIRGELGRGGMAIVYRAFDPQVRREVAVKILPPQFLNTGDFRARFQREAHTVASLEHPAIVPLYDYGEDGGQLYFVMRLMPGGSLANRLDHGPLPLGDVSRIITRIAPALDEAHAKGVIHRDLKPANILFDHHGEPYISDFGIAKVAEGGSTVSGNVVGTPAYMSPEQARGERDLDTRSDIYSLGAIIFEMLTGKVPFEADTPMGVALRHITDPVPSIRDVKPDLPSGCGKLIERAMAKERTERYASVAEVATALATIAARRATVSTERTIRGKPPTVLSMQRDTIPPPLPAAATSRGIPMWGWAIAGIAVLVISVVVGALVVSAVVSTAFNISPTPDATALARAQIIALTVTAEADAGRTRQAETQAAESAQATADASAQATSQAELATRQSGNALAQSTIEAAATATAAAQNAVALSATTTAAAEATTAALIAAPKIAFLNSNDVWVVNVDGGNLQQLTFDGGEKTNLRWLPDGKTIAYISGKCIQGINYLTQESASFGCFNSSDLIEGFEVSPDSRYFAISVDRILYVGDYNPEALSQVRQRNQLAPLANCMVYTRSGTKSVRWSADASQIAVMVLGVLDGLAADTVQLFRLDCGNNNPINLDQFPGTRFTLLKYSQFHALQNYAWDGSFLFALIDPVRNEGFGDLYIYNADTKRQPEKITPIDGVCCYRDPSWSADGSHFVFAFQDIRLGENSETQLYYAAYGSLGTGARLTPIPLPDNFFSDPRGQPQPAIAPPAP